MTIIITGASKGIGFSLAQNLVGRGHTVYSFSRSAPSDERIKYIACDISSEQSIAKAFDEFWGKEKHVDILVNNAGIGISGAVEKTKLQDMKQIFDVNVFGASMCSAHVIPKMREARAGKILFVSSVASTFTIPFQTFYSATKAAVDSLAEGLRMELKPFGIKVGTLMLGDIRSSFTANRQKDFEGDDIYSGRISKSVAVMERDERNGMCPDKVSKKIARYIYGRRLTPHKVFGFKYKMFCLLNKFLPRKWVLAIVYRIYGK